MTNKVKIWTGDWVRNGMLMPVGVRSGDTDWKKAKRVSDKYHAWKAWDSTDVPAKIHFAAYDYPEKKKILPNLLSITNGYILLSERLADCLREFDLGKTQLFEIPLYEYDQTTKRPGRHFLLNVAEVKSCFVPERSGKVEFLGKRWIAPYKQDLAVLSTAAEGVDLWADPDVLEALFFSDRLAKAIKKGKFGRTFLSALQVVEPD